MKSSDYFSDSGYDLFKALIDLNLINESDVLHLCGHSRGGRIASCCGMYLYRHGYRINDIKTFGSADFSFYRESKNGKLLQSLQNEVQIIHDELFCNPVCMITNICTYFTKFIEERDIISTSSTSENSVVRSSMMIGHTAYQY